MLGRLSRWLRILGFDTDYKLNEKDDTLINLAKEEGRILITKDLELYRRTIKSDVKALLLDSENCTNNLAIIARRYGLELKFKPEISRCSKCNAKLEKKQAEDVREQISPLILRNQNQFWQCINFQCKKIYWQGSHCKKIVERIDEAKNQT